MILCQNGSDSFSRGSPRTFRPSYRSIRTKERERERERDRSSSSLIDGIQMSDGIVSTARERERERERESARDKCERA